MENSIDVFEAIRSNDDRIMMHNPSLVNKTGDQALQGYLKLNYTEIGN